MRRTVLKGGGGGQKKTTKCFTIKLWLLVHPDCMLVVNIICAVSSLKDDEMLGEFHQLLQKESHCDVDVGRHQVLDFKRYSTSQFFCRYYSCYYKQEVFIIVLLHKIQILKKLIALLPHVNKSHHLNILIPSCVFLTLDMMSTLLPPQVGCQ